MGSQSVPQTWVPRQSIRRAFRLRFVAEAHLPGKSLIEFRRKRLQLLRDLLFQILNNRSGRLQFTGQFQRTEVAQA